MASTFTNLFNPTLAAGVATESARLSFTALLNAQHQWQAQWQALWWNQWGAAATTVALGNLRSMHSGLLLQQRYWNHLRRGPCPGWGWWPYPPQGRRAAAGP